jgi:Zn-dependent peptidase ImmA (M78 family)
LKRFTLYHEIFHILAYTHSINVFKKPTDGEVPYNEFLADHFPANILMPYDLGQEVAGIL